MRMRAVQSRAGPSYVMLASYYTCIQSSLESEARELLVLYAVPGSVWPTDSLLDKFRRFSHRNEARYSCPVGYRSKPKSFAS